MLDEMAEPYRPELFDSRISIQGRSEPFGDSRTGTSELLEAGRLNSREVHGAVNELPMAFKTRQRGKR